MMIFIPKELADKLQKKGYPMPTNIVYATYKQDGKLCPMKIVGEAINVKPIAPTIEQVLKWLRKKKNLHVTIELSDRNTYCWCIQFVDRRISRISSHFNNYFDNWEETALGAIRYALFNLI